MTVDPQAGIGELQRAEEQVHHFVRRIRGRGRLEHAHRVTAVGERSAAKGIAQRPRVEERRRLAVASQRWPPVTIEPGAGTHRRAFDDAVDIAFEIGQLVSAEHAGEDVETQPPVGLEDIGGKAPVGAEADRPPVAERERTRLAKAQIGAHRALLGAVIGTDARVERCQAHVDLPVARAVVQA